ncbi:class I glutamine amidotransferase-like protein [Basidiobolus meristosporus CBS 931.73]|uniref:Class I glutamine amidotransferase-like protein n=1 Tax=Basidiobolus meristosporus CBS 931.73 TaxID=1314790 RepID=A0A1Y1YQT5_9FUNG|nr:class I glutamine amidotransferase-like protein [Basidiobolus meristosporus CBS 931.73]|eukprot:ORY00107.1 class I glutamine amidotransferase-like protein [Basidiobolus meristosporus CBS 931.73]
MERLKPTTNISEHTTTLKIALLVADTPSQPVVEKFGDYTQIFPAMLKKAVAHSKRNIDFSIECFDVTQMQYPREHEAFHGVIITGSASSAASNEPWIFHFNEYIKQLIEDVPECKVVGVCFGHQLIARALGGTVAKNKKGWEIGHTEVKLNNAGKKLLKTNKDTLQLQQMHEDVVSYSPPGLEVLCSSDLCEVQAMLKPNHILTVQAHPEFTPGIVEEITRSREQQGKFTPEMASSVYSKLTLPDDSIWFATKIVEFFMGNFVEDS